MITVVQEHKQETSNTQAYKQEISYAQSQKKETSKQTNYKEINLSWTLDIQSVAFTIQNKSDSKTLEFIKYES